MSSRVMVRVLVLLVVDAAIVMQGVETVAHEEIVEQQANEIAELKQKAAQHEQKMTHLEKKNVRVIVENVRVREENVRVNRDYSHTKKATTHVDQAVLGQDADAGRDPARQCELK